MSTPPNTRRLYFTQTGHYTVQTHYTTMLNGYPVPHQSFYVPTRYGATHIVVSGRADNPPLVLLHGLGVHAMMWKPNIQALSQCFQVYAVDVIGDSGRSAPTRPSMLDASYASWLADVLDELALPTVNLAGMSLGGWMALSTALYHPQRVRKLFLLAPAGIVTLNTSLVMQWVFALLPHAWNSDFDMPSLLAKLCRHVDGEVGDMVYQITRHHRAKVVPPVPILANLELAQITTPTAIVIGSHDEMFHPQRLQRRAQHIPGLHSLNIIPRAGHSLNVTHVAALNERMIRFFCQ